MRVLAQLWDLQFFIFYFLKENSKEQDGGTLMKNELM